MGHAATVEADLFPPDPDLVENAPPEPDHIEGMSLRMTQAMNHYQKQEHQCFMCGNTGHFVRNCPHLWPSCDCWVVGCVQDPGYGAPVRTAEHKLWVRTLVIMGEVLWYVRFAGKEGSVSSRQNTIARPAHNGALMSSVI